MKRKVLFIDDEEKILKAIFRQFKNFSFESIFVTEPLEAFKVLENERVSVVVSDIKMPKMDGIELLKKVKKINPNIVRIVLSGIDNKELILKAINEGHIYQYILKPWEENELKIIVEQAIKYNILVEGQQTLLKILTEQNELLDSWSTVLESSISVCTNEVDTMKNEMKKLRNELESYKSINMF